MTALKKADIANTIAGIGNLNFNRAISPDSDSNIRDLLSWMNTGGAVYDQQRKVVSLRRANERFIKALEIEGAKILSGSENESPFTILDLKVANNRDALVSVARKVLDTRTKQNTYFQDIFCQNVLMGNGSRVSGLLTRLGRGNISLYEAVQEVLGVRNITILQRDGQPVAIRAKYFSYNATKNNRGECGSAYESVKADLERARLPHGISFAGKINDRSFEYLDLPINAQTVGYLMEKLSHKFMSKAA